MSVTRKDLIIEKFTLLEKELKPLFKGTIFPSLEEIDLADLVYYITITFLGIDSESQYNEKIQDLMKSNKFEVTEKVLGEISPKIIEFVSWLKQL